ncbi:hypothetical protein [Ileibacterium valens]|uniref:hypothetical protein n=1 Tax=Ileibacterium valens TaxID=1862668 RepID=UPI00273140EB|nr:hypothetical protein [Ileibacterium valens]
MNLHLDYDRVEIKRVASPADYPQYKKAYGLFYKDRLIKIFASYGLAAQYAEDSLAEELMLNRPKFFAYLPSKGLYFRKASELAEHLHCTAGTVNQARRNNQPHVKHTIVEWCGN